MSILVPENFQSLKGLGLCEKPLGGCSWLVFNIIKGGAKMAEVLDQFVVPFGSRFGAMVFLAGQAIL